MILHYFATLLGYMVDLVDWVSSYYYLKQKYSLPIIPTKKVIGNDSFKDSIIRITIFPGPKRLFFLLLRLLQVTVGYKPYFFLNDHKLKCMLYQCYMECLNYRHPVPSNLDYIVTVKMQRS